MLFRVPAGHNSSVFIKKRLVNGDNAVMSEDTRLIAEELSGPGPSLVTAESCTGGLIAKTLTDLAGSSAWFDRGFVTYSKAAKSDMLSVPASVIDE